MSASEPHLLVARYEAICRGLDHEAKVMNDRLTWAILFSGGLFAATAVLMNAAVSLDGEAVARAGQYSLILVLAVLIALIGLWFSFATKGGVEAAQDQFDYLRRQYVAFTKVPEARSLKLPRPFGNPHAHVRGNKVARTFPWVMIAVWGGALAAELVALFYYFGWWFAPT